MQQQTIEQMYQHYLQLISLSEAAMHPVQKEQLRHSFFAGFSFVLTEVVDQLYELPDKECFTLLNGYMEEMNTYFNPPFHSKPSLGIFPPKS